MSIWTDVFFWALVAALGLYASVVIFTSRTRFARPTYMLVGIAASLGYIGPRILIPVLPQPSLGLPAAAAWPLGGALVLLGVATMVRVIARLRANARNPARDAEAPLMTDGLFGLVRHPMYLGDVLWSLGLALALDAAYALLMVPVWWALRAGLAVFEEERLVDKHGDAYAAYRARVPDRILPDPRRIAP
jgi:protein-S-isoprenylcysteine O-methyltransferase Ste14